MDFSLKQTENKNPSTKATSKRGSTTERSNDHKRCKTTAPTKPTHNYVNKTRKKINEIISQTDNNTPVKKPKKLVQWNICGLRGKTAELQLLCNEHKPKIIALQETLFNKRKYFDTLNRKQYDWYLKGRLNGSRGGVAIAIDKAIPHKHLPIKSLLQSVACRTIGKAATTYASVYVPPTKFKPKKLKEELTKLIKQLPEPFVLMGDLNAHSTDWGSYKTTSCGRAVQEVIDELDLQLLNNGNSTKISHNSIKLSAIDLTIASQNTEIQKWETDKDCRSSDHFPIIITEESQTTEYNNKPTWDHRHADWEKFQSILKSSVQDDDTNTIESITEDIHAAARASIPRSMMRKSRKVPWWNKEVEKCVKARRAALRKFKKHKSHDKRKKILHKQLKIANNKAESTMKKAKQESWEHFLSTINDEVTETRELWNKIHALSGKSKKNKISLSDGKNVIDEPAEIANKLADQFHEHSATKQYSRKFQALKRQTEAKSLDLQYTSNKTYNNKFTLDELNQALEKADGKATGKDEISYDMLRHLPVETKIILLKVYNKEWAKGTLPAKSWKEGIVVPIPKTESNPHDIKNYRPITLLSCVGKILDRMVNKRLMTILEEDLRLDPNQFAFRQTKGVDDLFTELEGFIAPAIKKGWHVECALLDISKAYDKAWRRPILEQLRNWGIEGNMIRYIENFLSDRTFQVEIGTTKSETKEQENGIPQGAVLSVTLFLVAMYSITRKYNKSNKRIKILVYADDITIITIGRNKRQLRARLQDVVDKVSTWARRKGFTIAPQKSKMIHICKVMGSHEDPSIPDIEINNTPIPEVKSAKLLGITIDNRFNFRKHMEVLKKDVTNRCNMIKVIGGRYRGAKRTTMLRVINSIITSKLLYGAHLYSRGPEKSRKQIYPEYNQSIRTVTGALKTSRVSSILAEAGVLPLETLIKMSTVTKAIKWLENHNANQESGHPLLERANRFALILTNEEIPPIALRQNTTGIKWYEPKVKIDWSIKKAIKAGEQQDKAIQVFLETYNKYPDHYKIYTDGSVKEDDVGCGIHSKDENISMKLNNMCTIFSAEGKALLEAIKTIAKTNQPNIIFTDSAGCLEALKKGTSHHPWIEEVIREAAKKNITFCWVPSHVGIKGNENADKLAEIGRESEIQSPEVPAADAAKWFQSRTRWKHEAIWRREDNSFLRQTKPTTLPWKDRQDVAIQKKFTRLRIGHTWLSHGWIIKKVERPKCKVCNVYLTADHLIRFCPAHDECREKHNITGLSVYNNTKESEDKLLAFIEEIDIAKEI